MLSPQIKAQVEAVLRARQLEDKAYRAVMAITKAMPIEEAELIVEEHKKLTRMTAREEYRLVNMTIKAVEPIPS